jgi:hypothetical protein
VICNFVCFAPWIAYLVGPVEPVELHEFRPAQVEPPGGTGGTGGALAFSWRKGAVPPVTPSGTTKNRQKGLKYHRFHRLHLPHYDSFTGLKTIFASRLESIS